MISALNLPWKLDHAALEIRFLLQPSLGHLFGKLSGYYGPKEPRDRCSL